VPFRALLDACVLVPAALRDTLLRAGEAYLYQPLWSELILAETEQTLVNALGVSAADAADLTDAMREAFPDAVVAGFKDLIPAMTVDPQDRHVAAAAIVGHAQVIVTLNTKHFPQHSLATYHVDVQSPDAFLIHLFTLDPETMAQIIRNQAADLQSPSMTPAQVCDALLATAPGFVALVRPLLS
jgi:hypothetical protein